MNQTVDTIPKSSELVMEKKENAMWLCYYSMTSFFIGFEVAPVLERRKWITPNAIWGQSYLAFSARVLGAMLGLGAIGAWAKTNKQVENTHSLIESNKRSLELYRKTKDASRDCERLLAVLDKSESRGVDFDKESLRDLKSDCYGKFDSIHYKYYGW